MVKRTNSDPPLSSSISIGLRVNRSPTIYLRLAVQILSEHDLVLPELDQLNLIVQSALAVRCLYFAACLHHPDHAELHEVFKMFLMACATCAHETEN